MGVWLHPTECMDEINHPCPHLNFVCKQVTWLFAMNSEIHTFITEFEVNQFHVILRYVVLSTKYIPLWVNCYVNFEHLRMTNSLYYLANLHLKYTFGATSSLLSWYLSVQHKSSLIGCYNPIVNELHYFVGNMSKRSFIYTGGNVALLNIFGIRFTDIFTLTTSMF